LNRYFIRLSYCGTKYNGWQVQPHKGTATVQGTLENAMTLYLRTPISLVGCGRTDTGVHARDYIAHFEILDVPDLKSAVYRINKILPADIAVHDIFEVDLQAHARFDAISRSYHYDLHTEKSPFHPYSFYYVYEKPDLALLNEAAAIILQYSEFDTFCKMHSDVKTTKCRIEESFWIQDGAHYRYRITADRFLRGMIRLIVGMCLQVARGKVSLKEVHIALATKQKLDQDWSVPAEGLMLCDIKY
jgi:tRNA pseudouridine38-40 synthase